MIIYLFYFIGFLQGHSKISSSDENKQAQQLSEVLNKSIPWVTTINNSMPKTKPLKVLTK